MAQSNPQQEPTMEEILASIRRIISEDTDEGGAEAAAPEDGDVVEGGEDAIEEILEATEVVEEPDEEVLELTQVVEETAEEMPEPEPEPEPLPKMAVQRPRPQPQPVAFDDEEDVMLVDREESETGEALLSAATSSAMVNALGQLKARTRVANDPKTTLEDIVRAMLKPMLKSWLDENLPSLVERLVQEEIDRVSRQQAGR